MQNVPMTGVNAGRLRRKPGQLRSGHSRRGPAYKPARPHSSPWSIDAGAPGAIPLSSHAAGSVTWLQSPLLNIRKRPETTFPLILNSSVSWPNTSARRKRSSQRQKICARRLFRRPKSTWKSPNGTPTGGLRALVLQLLHVAREARNSIWKTSRAATIRKKGIGKALLAYLQSRRKRRRGRYQCKCGLETRRP